MNAYITDSGIIRNSNHDLIAVFLDKELVFSNGFAICETIEEAFEILAKAGLI